MFTEHSQAFIHSYIPPTACMKLDDILAIRRSILSFMEITPLAWNKLHVYGVGME